MSWNRALARIGKLESLLREVVHAVDNAPAALHITNREPGRIRAIGLVQSIREALAEKTPKEAPSTANGDLTAAEAAWGMWQFAMYFEEMLHPERGKFCEKFCDAHNLGKPPKKWPPHLKKEF